MTKHFYNFELLAEALQDDNFIINGNSDIEVIVADITFRIESRDRSFKLYRLTPKGFIYTGTFKK